MSIYLALVEARAIVAPFPYKNRAFLTQVVSYIQSWRIAQPRFSAHPVSIGRRSCSITERSMGYLCDYCGDQRSLVFCRSDAASLCLSCDCTVHSANALSRRHSRTLVCERCNSQPAFVRCLEEKLSLCQNCDWMGHANSNGGPAHKRQPVNCYSGCPSASELSAVWPFLFNSTSGGNSACERKMGSMSITDDGAVDRQETQDKAKVQNESLRGEGGSQLNMDMDKTASWMESLTPLVDQPTASTSSSMPKVSIYVFCITKFVESDNIYGTSSEV